ncbi:acetolactate synthase 2 small subunit [Shewanella sp.]|nr:acetolactate synthase 2 small subunit [Shewanella sp.]
MNHYTLAIKVQHQPEVLERLLRVVRHRGFDVINLAMQTHENDTSSIEFSVRSDRAIALLTNQLNKLIDIVDCQVLASEINKTTEFAKG